TVRGEGKISTKLPIATETAGESAQGELSAGHRRLLDDLMSVIEEFSGNGKRPGRAEVDRKEVERAFRYACERHGDQKRQSGDEFITHPVGVAMICAGLRLDTATLCAALLHDTVEDTPTSKEQIEEQFGSEV